MKDAVSQYGLDLNGSWTIRLMSHIGRHPNAYHDWILNNIYSINKIPNINTEIFLKEFNKRIVQPVLEHPEMLNKAFWKLKK